MPEQFCTVDYLCAAATSELGYDGDKATVASAAVRSLAQRYRELPPLPCGSTEKQWRKLHKAHVKALRDAVFADVSAKISSGEIKIAFGVLGVVFTFLTGGLGMVVLSIVSSCIEWWVAKWLDHQFGPKMQAVCSLAAVPQR